MDFGEGWGPTFLIASAFITSQAQASEIFRFGLCIIIRCEEGKASTQLDLRETVILRHWRGNVVVLCSSSHLMKLL
jgi:hypothetical protein